MRRRPMMIRRHKPAHLATPSRSILAASRTSREWDLGDLISQYRRHVGSSERRTAYRAGDETGGRLQPIPKVGWKAVQFDGRVGNAEWPLRSVRLRDVCPSGRARPIAAPMHSIVQVFQFLFERFSVGLPCHAIDSGRSVSREREVAPL